VTLEKLLQGGVGIGQFSSLRGSSLRLGEPVNSPQHCGVLENPYLEIDRLDILSLQSMISTSNGSKESSGKISALEYVADDVYREMKWQWLRCGGAPAIWATTLAEPPQAPDLDHIFNEIVNLNSQFS